MEDQKVIKTILASIPVHPDAILDDPVVDPGGVSQNADEMVETAIVPTSEAHPMPMFDGTEMVKALHAYRELQAALDAEMPEAIEVVRGKKFRKKIYWRTIARAFSLSVGEVPGSEALIKTSGGDWGYKVTYRAESKTGDYADGDGACMASEKHGNSDTIHNVRSHAHTRAFNRATANLCGFGEGSYDEGNPSGGGLHDHGTPMEGGDDSKAVQSQPEPRTPKSDEPWEVESLVEDVFVAQKNGEPVQGVNKFGATWSLWVIKLANNESGSTFKDDVADHAKSCMKRGIVVNVRFKKNGDYTNIVDLTETVQPVADDSQQPEKPMSIEEDIPF